MKTSGAEDEEEEFYESLDHLLSRSSSSASASASADDDDDDDDEDDYIRRLPSATVSFDVWISEPASVEERRRHLLHQLGLSGDPTLSRAKTTSPPLPPAKSTGDPPPLPAKSTDAPPLLPVKSTRPYNLLTPLPAEEVGRSASCDALIPRLTDPSPAVTAATAAVRSRSDGAVNPRPPQRDRSRDLPYEVGTGQQLSMEEFEIFVGHSPIVQELMRRQRSQDTRRIGEFLGAPGMPRAGPGAAIAARWRKKRASWVKSIKSMADTVIAGGHHWDKRSGDERDVVLEKGGRRSSSVADESIDKMQQPDSGGPVRIGVRHYGKHYKELSSLFMTGEICAHTGSIWCIKFSLNGQYLASAGEDHVIHVWQVTECESKRDLLLEGAVKGDVNCHPFLALIGNEPPESTVAMSCLEVSHCDRKTRAKAMNSRRYMNLDHVMVPENVFALSEKPICSFKGHVDDVLDLSWSKSQYLLSSSMDKTVKLWHMSSTSCLKTFSHSDYVTCIQFNPVDDRYFISGSLDEKVRIWSIPDRQVVDWNDLHEMVTAVCYTPDGQSALVGSHKGSCHRYNTSDNKLHHKVQIHLGIKKKMSSSRKITGFQFTPGSSSEVLITSADSRIRVVDGLELVHKFTGFRNTSSQISASLSTNAKYVICASEDSQVYVWKYDADSWPSGSSRGAVTVSKSYEHFHCQDVTAAVPWPVVGSGGVPRNQGNTENGPDRFTSTWPEEKLLMGTNHSYPQEEMQVQSKSAWKMVIVTAGRGGEIKIFQNFGFPVRI